MPNSFAWFNYAPGVADRDTLELLLSEAVSEVQARETDGRVAGAAALDRRAHEVQRDDSADLELILTTLRAFVRHEQITGSPSAVKPLRELIFFRWEGPRLPAGGKYSRLLPHSPAARAQRSSGQDGGLVYEHVTPISTVVRGLLTDVPPDASGLRAVLDATSDRVIITKAEDARLSTAGFRNAAADPADPWSRYRALGLDRLDFRPMTAG